MNCSSSSPRLLRSLLISLQPSRRNFDTELVISLTTMRYSTRRTMAAAILFGLSTLVTADVYPAEPKPEKGSLNVAVAAYGPLYLPLLVAHESGYFSKRGVNLNISLLSATASAQALLSGQVDIYQGGASTIHANIGGSDLIYIGASVDRSTLVLFGQNG